MCLLAESNFKEEERIRKETFSKLKLECDFSETFMCDIKKTSINQFNVI